VPAAPRDVLEDREQVLDRLCDVTGARLDQCLAAVGRLACCTERGDDLRVAALVQPPFVEHPPDEVGEVGQRLRRRVLEPFA
jgi:hypothetical protein